MKKFPKWKFVVALLSILVMVGLEVFILFQNVDVMDKVTLSIIDVAGIIVQLCLIYSVK